jgi:ElaB/YqjD/DUF883 family membrane-anchored ribosome-binding protein
MISPEKVQMAVNAMCRALLTDTNPLIRLKAAETLGMLGNEAAIPALCQAWQQDNDLSVRLVAANAIVQIITQSIQPMSDTPKDAPKYDLRGANIGNFADNVQGDQNATQYIYAQEQDLAEAATKIQQLLTQLAQTYPSQTDSPEETLRERQIEAVKREANRNPQFRDRLLKAAKAGGVEAVKQLLDYVFKNPVASVVAEAVKAFVEAG